MISDRCVKPIVDICQHRDKRKHTVNCFINPSPADQCVPSELLSTYRALDWTLALPTSKLCLRSRPTFTAFGTR